MDTLTHYRQLIQHLLTQQTRVPYAYGNIQLETVFDPQADRYVLITLGRDQQQHRVHGCLVHIDIIEGKLWIQRDGTERGIAQELVEAGVSKEQIVLGFRSPEMRKLTEFAVG